MIVFLIVISILNIMVRKKTLRDFAGEVADLKNRKETVGWITLCPTCKEEHSTYRNKEKGHTSGPVHCKSCGKQFMLLEGKAHVIKH